MTGIIPPTAWIFAQFSAANVSSAVLVSSNPTNLVLSGAFSLAYTSYTAFLILPTLFAAILLYPVLLILFTIQSRRTNSTMIPDAILLPSMVDLDFAKSMLVDPPGALIGSVLLLSTLVVLVATSPLKPTIPVWEVTVPGALLMLIRDVVADHKRWKKSNEELRRQPRKKTVDLDAVAAQAIAAQKTATAPTNIPESKSTSISPLTEEPGQINYENKDDQPGSTSNTPYATDDLTARSTLPLPATSSPLEKDTSLSGRIHKFTHELESYLPTACTVAKGLPLPLLPFAFSMFILVQGLVNSGWVDVFASWWTVVQNRAGVAGSVFIMTFISSALCNTCGTNIGTTILLARTLKLSLEASPLPFGAKTNPVVFALAFGTNIGAFTFSFSASLAGLLWRGILRQKGIYVRLKEFASLNVVLWLSAAVMGSTVLVIQHKIVN